MIKHALFLLCLTDILIVYIVANENTVFLYNHIENCKSTEYYDVNYFLCRECDPQLNLLPSQNGKKSSFLKWFFFFSEKVENETETKKIDFGITENRISLKWFILSRIHLSNRKIYEKFS